MKRKNKLTLIRKNLEDSRSKKVLFTAHCLLNENTRYLGGAFRKGVVKEFVDEIYRNDIGIVQMKCPEQKAWGGILKKKMWLGLGIKNSLLYKFRKLYLIYFKWHTRRICRKIAKEVINEINDYLKIGFQVVGIIGVRSSPCCGVFKTLQIENSVEYLACLDVNNLDRNEFNKNGIEGPLIDGNGFFIKELEKLVHKKAIPIKFYEYDFISEMNGTTISFTEFL
jgi:predicted secreted protein